MTHRRALSGGMERGTNERPEIWSCDLWANERPQNKFHLEGTDKHTHGHRDSLTESAQWANSVKIRYYLNGSSWKIEIKAPTSVK